MLDGAEIPERDAELPAAMTEMGAATLPSLPEEVNTLELAHRHAITTWKAELRSLKRSMSKAGANGAAAPDFATLLAPADQAARLGSEWPRRGENRCRSCPICLAGGCRKQGRAVQCSGCQHNRRCDPLVCTTPYLETPSVAASVASSGSIIAETLAVKISWVVQAGEEYRTTFYQYTDKLCRLGLEHTNTPTRSHAALEQELLNRRQEEEEMVEQARAQLENLRRWRTMRAMTTRVEARWKRPSPPYSTPWGMTAS